MGDQANSIKVTFAKVETNQTILNVTTEGKGSVEINGQTLTGGDVLVKTGEAVRVKSKSSRRIQSRQSRS